MTFPIIPGGSPSSYQISRSLRFRSSNSAYLSRTFGSGNRSTWTWSGWYKCSNLGTTYRPFLAYSTSEFGIGGASAQADCLYFNQSGVWSGYTAAVFRDPAAWYHIMFVYDTTQATAANRIKVYVNGVQYTFTTEGGTLPSQNSSGPWNQSGSHTSMWGSGFNYFDGYAAEVYFIDGQALTPSSFGQTDSTTGVWSPIAYTGTYGTNGFYLKFADNSGATATTIGKDSSGNGNNWTPSGISVTAGTTNDSLVDSPTNYGSDTGAGGEVRGNYCTLSGVDKESNLTLINGNLQASSSTTVWYDASGTIWSTDSFYFETTVNETPGGTKAFSAGVANTATPNGGSHLVGDSTGTYGVWWSTVTMYRQGNGAAATSITTPASGDIYGFACKPSTGEIWIARNNTWLSGSPSAGTGALFTGNSGIPYTPRCAEYNSGGAGVFIYNFGQRPFAYTAPSGFKALCTQNLTTPAIAKGNQYFDVYTRSGTGAAATVSGKNFQPDLVWVKSRSLGAGGNHVMVDSVRGASNELYPNLTNAASSAGTVTAFNSDGYTLGPDGDYTRFNASGQTYVDWFWKGGNSSGSSNTSGTITSTVSANTTAGFSIAKYTGTGTAGTIGHGLGVAPNFIIVKSRDYADNWYIYSDQIGNTKYLILNSTQAAAVDAKWNNTSPTSSVFSVGGAGYGVNGNTNTYVAYCFAAIPGFSAFGSYTGNGSADGPFVFCGLRPRVILVKNTGSSAGWQLYDTSRDTYNVMSGELAPNASAAESTFAMFDSLSNGFKLRTTDYTANTSGTTYIYAAFAESPFKYSLAR